MLQFINCTWVWIAITVILSWHKHHSTGKKLDHKNVQPSLKVSAELFIRYIHLSLHLYLLFKYYTQTYFEELQSNLFLAIIPSLLKGQFSII